MMNGLVNIPKKVLFQIARESIRTYLDNGSLPDFSGLVSIYPQLSEKKGSFVTVYLNHDLKGCIGRIEGEKSLCEDLANNAIDAAFNDYRFRPLVRGDYSKLKIEISILTKPEKLKYKCESELLEKIFEGKYGIIIEYQGGRSTYLPQVWDSYTDPKVFMDDLAAKGGFESGVWNEKGCLIKTYKAEVFEEN